MRMQTTDRESSLALIHMIDDLPSLPDRYARIRAVVDDPRSGAQELARIVATDQGTSTMVLKFANSPRHNVSNKVIASLPVAIARLGTRETAHIAMTMSLLYGFALPTGMGNIRAFWTHAFAVALLCKQMAELVDIDQDTMFTAGLLHDIGRAILGIRIDMDYFESRLGCLQGEALVRAERETFGLDHTEAGEELLKLWQFPAVISRTIRSHHDASASDIHARVLHLADSEVHRRIPHHSNIDTVEERLFDEPELPRQLLTKAGLIRPEDSVTGE